MSHQKVVGVLCRDDSDSLSEDEEFCPQSVLDKLPCYTARQKKYLLRHGYDFKNLLKKSLHDRFNPSFSDLFTKDTSKVAMLEREKNGQPKMIKLAEDIGFTTDLVYGEDGFLNVDLSVFREEFWNVE